ncbi:hypothetical protein [Paracraurococcus lichenis]|uniref:Uncharacterized protein n=1 Tax=Paracraurococcus lichenis TaxID=3064888 RepID=A0ABT9E918_9PROT|nr:hypothetical protein [Paracraurococcus sp. LOR1-02]MDO9712478.1 hypothetical protein [Paracraurococcus sp. LOR1-02]
MADSFAEFLAGELTTMTDDLRRHRRALIRAMQKARGCATTGTRCRASEDCACCQAYEEAIADA